MSSIGQIASVNYETDVNCYPDCTNQNIKKKLLTLNPCFDLAIIQPDWLLSGNGSTLLDELVKLGKNAANLGTGTPTEDGVNLNYNAFDNLYGFLSMMNGKTIVTYHNIPIFSSPQISTNNGAGWNHEQSLYDFVQTSILGGSVNQFLSKLGIDSLIQGGFNSMANVANFTGLSPRISPFFSFKENPFNITQSINVTIKLINDSEENAKMNHKFLNNITKESLIYINGASTMHNWTNMPKLFNVGLKWGASNSNEYVKCYHLCKLQSSVTPHGLMRQQKYPDAYLVDLTFNSIMPETQNTWGIHNKFPE